MAEAPFGADAIDEGAPLASDVEVHAEQTGGDAEGDGEEEDFDDGHLIFEISQVFDHDFQQFRKCSYTLDSLRCRAGGASITPDPREDEVVIFEHFFHGGLRFPLNPFVGEVLRKFDVYLHQLTPNVFA